MGHGASGAGRTPTPTYKTKGEKLTKALVIEEVRVIEVPQEFIVPRITYKDQEQIKLITNEETQTKYNTKVEDTTKYNKIEKDTIEYIRKEEPTTEYVAKKVEVELPVPIDTPYERPVLTNKEYTIASIKDMENVRALMDLLPKMSQAIDELRKKVEGLTKYKLVEKEIDAPKINWIPTNVERIIWTDVERERPK